MVLKQNFNIFNNTLDFIPSLSKNKIKEIISDSNNNINLLSNMDLSFLYAEYDKRIDLINEDKLFRSNFLEIFEEKYNYDNKQYWTNLINNVLKSTFNNLLLNFI